MLGARAEEADTDMHLTRTTTSHNKRKRGPPQLDEKEALEET